MLDYSYYVVIMKHEGLRLNHETEEHLHWNVDDDVSPKTAFLSNSSETEGETMQSKGI